MLLVAPCVKAGGASKTLMALRCWTGFEVLTAMEKVPVRDEDRPAEPISINGATVFVNPFKDEEEEERKAADKVSICTSWVPDYRRCHHLAFRS